MSTMWWLLYRDNVQTGDFYMYFSMRQEYINNVFSVVGYYAQVSKSDTNDILTVILVIWKHFFSSDCDFLYISSAALCKYLAS